ncbi:arylsulfatase [Cytophaga sp. FL35]|uniref:arylsulfatase n=1 Tax=Cytophaga sp. FL35 TaxID=1904456 RepID=UPI001653DB3C|nr:arylsulfatase [Cytophaga sp. FL35]MBC6998609.1 arylsulfatase [Cytophaga sp. FL35]
MYRSLKLILVCCYLLQPFYSISQSHKKPNVILIITDDQGYGDLGFTGNPHVKTPVIDQLAKESVRFNQFYVSPVCAPTRSSLMTGRYSLRTGIRDTYNGGAIMATEEVTIAEMLKTANYRTGIFGKWHLGDNYPSRPSDQGFDESLIHLSGGMGQVGDITTYFQGDRSYFDPVLWHNNQQQKYEGYCSDIFTQEAVRFIENNKDEPFFCYLSFNAPHTPLQVPEKYYEKYKQIDPTSGFDTSGQPFPEMSEKDKEDARKVYAMVSNIDDNIGLLLKKLKELKLQEDTVVIFMTDNGPQQRRYVAGLKGRKGKVYQGGVRVPFFMKFPKTFKKEDVDIETTAVHMDVLPTLASICGASIPKDRTIDGKDLLPLINGNTVDWEGRPLFFYWTRKYPELYQNMSILQGEHKLVGNVDYNAQLEKFELYNLHKDPFEQENIISQQKELSAQLKMEMDIAYKELISSEHMVNPPRILLGHQQENPAILNRNDAGGERGIWSQEEVFGKWRVSIQEGTYNLKFKFIKPIDPQGKMYVETNSIIRQITHEAKTADVIEMNEVYFPAMETDLITFYSQGGKNIMPFWVEMEKID